MIHFAVATLAWSLAHAAPATCVDRFRALDFQFQKDAGQLARSVQASRTMTEAFIVSTASSIVLPGAGVPAAVLFGGMGLYSAYGNVRGEWRLTRLTDAHVITRAVAAALGETMPGASDAFLKAVGTSEAAPTLAELVRRMDTGELCTTKGRPKSLGQIVRELRADGFGPALKDGL